LASKFDHITELLEYYKQKNIYRELRISQLKKENSKNSFYLDKKRVINLCSNDYLGLSQKSFILKKIKDTLDQVSQCSSRLLSGNDVNLKKLEDLLANHRTTENALVYPTGYMANLGVITALSTLKHIIYSDSLNHASIIDACKLANSKKIEIYNHNDFYHLTKLLKKNRSAKKVIVSEGIYSMDGDIAKLQELSELANTHDSILIVDDAHGDFVYGKYGNFGGTPEYCGVEKNIDIHISSLSKGLGCFGGYAACSNLIYNYLINKSRQFIYTSAIPEHLAIAAISAIYFLKKNRNIQTNFFKKINWFSNQVKQLGFNIGNSSSQIIPVIIGDEKQTLNFSNALLKNGIFVQAIRYPTVALGKSRLRISLNNSLQKSQLVYVINCLEKLGRKHNLI